MLLITHVIIAITSLIVTGMAYFNPKQTTLLASSFLIAMTLVSGTALVVLSSVSLMHACVSGLAYTTIASFGSYLARRRLQLQSNILK